MGEKNIALAVTMREEAGKSLNAGRKAGMIPAVLYGHGVEPKYFWVTDLDFKKVYREAGESTIIDVTVSGKSKAKALIQDVQLDPISGRFIHIDFYEVHMNEKLEAGVPIEFVGEAPAVRELGGIFVHTLEEIEVRCLPADLPHAISVDLGMLVNFDVQIKVKDIKVASGVEILTDSETVIALVEAPRTQAEIDALAEKADMDVTKVEGVVKETAPVPEKKEEK